MHVETNIKFIPIRLMVLGIQNVKCIRFMGKVKIELKKVCSYIPLHFLNFEISNSLNFKVLVQTRNYLHNLFFSAPFLKYKSLRGK